MFVEGSVTPVTVVHCELQVLRTFKGECFTVIIVVIIIVVVIVVVIDFTL